VIDVLFQSVGKFPWKCLEVHESVLSGSAVQLLNQRLIIEKGVGIDGRIEGEETITSSFKQ
jgi:hypothetical protein